MRKVSKKLVALLFAAVLAFVPVFATAVPVAAANYVKKFSQTVTLYDSASAKTIGNVTNGISANVTMLGLTMKTNKPVRMTSNDNSVAVLELQNGTGLARNRIFINVRAKKAGKAVIFYKLGDITYKVNVTVKKYASPLAGLKLGTSNLTSRVSKTPVYKVPYKKYANKKVKLTFRGKSGWSVSASYTPSSTRTKSVNINNNGYFKVTKKNSSVVLYAYNMKTMQQESVVIQFI